MEPKGIFIFDAETDGLYGQTLSIAAQVVNTETAETTAVFYGAVPDSTIQNPWVRENVLPHLGNARPFKDEKSLLEAFWAFWEGQKECCGGVALCDVPCPVEANVLRKCIELDRTREYEGPYPLFDLASMLAAKGIDPDASRDKLACSISGKSFRQHDAAEDVEITSIIYRWLIA